MSIRTIFFLILLANSLNALEIKPCVFIPPQSYLVQNTDLSKRTSSFPYISGDTFRSVANFIIDEIGIPFNVTHLKQGDIIFLKTDLLEYFFSEIHPRIKCKYILITHNGDLSCPRNYAHMLDDHKLIAWFAQNMDLSYHPKLFPIPIGIANKCWPHGNVDTLDVLLKTTYSNRPILLYSNMAQQTHPERQKVQQIFSSKSFCYRATQKPWKDYLFDLSRSKYILSPRGNGLDCHRTWEALLMGCIPIVRTSTLDALYTDLPILIVNQWEDITEELLVKEYPKLVRKFSNKDKIYASHWINQIKKCQQYHRS